MIRMGWGLWLRVIVCLTVIGCALSVLLLNPEREPDNGLQVREVTAEDGQRDWIIRVYNSVGAHGQQTWQAQGEGYRVDIQRRGQHGFLLDLAYRPSSQAWHRVRQQVRLREGSTLVAAFGQEDQGGEIRVIVERVK